MMNDVLNGLWADRIILAGLIAGALSALAYIPYIMDAVARRTQPCRATWLIWTVLASISAASNLYEGAGASMIFIAVQVVGTAVIFGLSMTRGYGHYLSVKNVVLLTAAAIGLAAWWQTDSALYALCISIGISALGGGATIWKAFRVPQSETLSMWVISAVAAGFGVISVGRFDTLLLAYPAYLLALYTAIVVAMGIGHLTGQGRDRDVFVWSSRRARPGIMPPPCVTPAHLPAPTPLPSGAAFRPPAAVETDIRQTDVA